MLQRFLALLFLMETSGLAGKLVVESSLAEVRSRLCNLPGFGAVRVLCGRRVSLLDPFGGSEPRLA
jgi:hypothetical protein